MRRPSSAVERHLTGLHRCGGGGPAAGGVTTSRLAEALGLSVPSVSTMLGRLQETNLVVRAPAGGWKLIDAGRGIAHRVDVHHRLIAAHLVRELGLSPGEAEREAARLAQHLSPRARGPAAGDGRARCRP